MWSSSSSGRWCTHAGCNHCVYWKREAWAGFGASLELTVTGEGRSQDTVPLRIYKDKPSLTAHPGPPVAPGGIVALLCQAPHFYANFILCRDRGASLPRVCLLTPGHARSSSPREPVEGGTYVCYASRRVNSCPWSLPSDPLDLSFPGE